ncbi:MAG: helix-turn-helix domain-containing protein [Lachnospiraceae bacterium]|nr:helix-turn-helix domain-containing protein [Lachnospiraceae bacterium]
MADISNNIRKLRTEQGMSQAQLAERIGVTRQTVSSWERGTSFPDLGMLEKLSEAFETEPARLLDPAYSAGRKREKPISYSFVIKAVLLFLFVYILGLFFGLPVLSGIFGNAAPYFWSLVLLIGFIAFCTCLILEHISDCTAPGGAAEEYGPEETTEG